MGSEMKLIKDFAENGDFQHIVENFDLQDIVNSFDIPVIGEGKSVELVDLLAVSPIAEEKEKPKPIIKKRKKRKKKQEMKAKEPQKELKEEPKLFAEFVLEQIEKEEKEQGKQDELTQTIKEAVTQKPKQTKESKESKEPVQVTEIIKAKEPFIIKWKTKNPIINQTRDILDKKIGGPKVSNMTLGKYLEILFPKGNEAGYISTNRKENGIMKQTMADVESAYQYLDIKKDCYVSMNTFFIPQRRAIRARHIHSLYLDIDYYKTPYTKEQVIEAVEWLVKNEEIPLPTLIAHSGRGIYLS